MQYIENKTFDEIQVGDSAELTRKLKTEDIELFAVMSGDVNPAHVDEEYARSDMFHGVIAHGMWGGALIDVPHYPKPLFVTDAAINIFPDLDTKRDIVQNAIDLALALGIERPKVAILSAVETVYPKIPSTIDAAALCKMWDRGQITGGVLDGPLAFDNAVSKSAAVAKGIVSDVAGVADILVVPDLEAGNMVAKQLIHLAGAEAAGIALGARVPIILTSRSDGVMSRLASSAMAQLYIHRAKTALS